MTAQAYDILLALRRSLQDTMNVDLDLPQALWASYERNLQPIADVYAELGALTATHKTDFATLLTLLELSEGDLTHAESCGLVADTFRIDLEISLACRTDAAVQRIEHDSDAARRVA